MKSYRQIRAISQGPRKGHAFAKTTTTTLDSSPIMKIAVTLIPGDGIGPEITESVKSIFAAAGAPITWDEHNAGESVLETHGALIPDTLIASIKQNKVALKGPCTTPVGKGFKSVNVTLRQKLDLYANVRPGKSVPGVDSRFQNVDLVTLIGISSKWVISLIPICIKIRSMSAIRSNSQFSALLWMS